MPDSINSRQRQDILAGRVFLLSALLTSGAVLLVLVFLIHFSRPLFSAEGLRQVLSWEWRPYQGSFGILPMVVGTLCLSVSALVLSFPVGLCICCFIHGIGPRKPGRLLLALVQFMTSVPTVVYGFVAAFVLVPVVRDFFGTGTGFSWLSAALTLGVLILPTVVLMLHSQFSLVEPGVRLTAAALGLEPWQKLVYLVFPQASRGFLAAAVLGFGRAVGDTLISLMLTGNAPQVPHSMLDSIRTMTGHIALVVATDSQSIAYLSLFACGLILFLTAVAVNLGLRWVKTGTNTLRGRS